MNKYRIMLNNDEDLVREIRDQIQNNQGHCPCAIIKNEDTKCPCRAFRERDEIGECHCGLYVKIINNQ